MAAGLSTAGLYLAHVSGRPFSKIFARLWDPISQGGNLKKGGWGRVVVSIKDLRQPSAAGRHGELRGRQGARRDGDCIDVPCGVPAVLSHRASPAKIENFAARKKYWFVAICSCNGALRKSLRIWRDARFLNCSPSASAAFIGVEILTRGWRCPPMSWRKENGPAVLAGPYGGGGPFRVCGPPSSKQLLGPLATT